MKRRSKPMDQSRPLKMGFMMKFLCFTFIGRAIAMASSNVAVENIQKALDIKNSNKTKTSEENERISPIESMDVHSRKSRALPTLDTDNNEENYLRPQTFISEDIDKRTIPMIRFGRSEASMIPTLRFGRSGTSIIPTMRFGRSTTSMIPTFRFGRSDNSMIPTFRFGRSDNSMIPTFRFGRSDNSMIPNPRFGRTFKNSEDSFSEADIISKVADEEYFEEKNDLYESNVSDNDGEFSISHTEPIEKRQIDDYRSVIPYPRLGRELGTDSEDMNNSLDFINKVLKRQTNDSIIPQIRYGRSTLIDKKANEIKSPIFILPNIRPGRSANGNLEETIEPYVSDVQGFLGLFGAFRRSDDDTIDDSRNLQKTQLGKKVQDFLFNPNTDQTYKQLEKLRESSTDSLYVIPYPRPGKRQIGKTLTELQAQKDLAESNDGTIPHLYKINKISEYVLPYPRPGKKRREKEDISEYTRSKRSASILPYPRTGRSSSILPYPRPGRFSSILPYPRPGRSSSVLPYPRPGRSSLILPYPRPGRSMVILPYPRPGRSSEEGNYMLPYPRPGRSKQSSIREMEANQSNNQLDSHQELKRTKRNSDNYELTYMLNPLSKDTVGSINHNDLERFDSVQGMDGSESKLLNSHDSSNFLNKFKGHETHSNPIYILPYPRPGRGV